VNTLRRTGRQARVLRGPDRLALLRRAPATRAWSRCSSWRRAAGEQPALVGGESGHPAAADASTVSSRWLNIVCHLDPDRPEDRRAIAALRASSSRLLDEPRGPATHRNLRDTIRQLLGKHRGHAAQAAARALAREASCAHRVRHAPCRRGHTGHPHSPWERGSNENLNRIVREYFPKGVEISSDPRYLAMAACDINNRPRKIHNWKKPAELFAELITSDASAA
jgi:hypothetical protein